MELVFNADSDYSNCVYYTKTMDNNTELCLICMTDEHENNQHWSRYELCCGHIFHTRCLRRWCSVKNHLNCSYCGNIPEDKTSEYCDIHGVFGVHKCKAKRII